MQRFKNFKPVKTNIITDIAIPKNPTKRYITKMDDITCSNIFNTSVSPRLFCCKNRTPISSTRSKPKMMISHILNLYS